MCLACSLKQVFEHLCIYQLATFPKTGFGGWGQGEVVFRVSGETLKGYHQRNEKIKYAYWK